MTPQETLTLLAILVAMIFAVGIGYTLFSYRKMDRLPGPFKGKDPETHYRR